MSSPDRRSVLRLLAVGALALPAAGCFQPMYAARRDGQPGLRDKLLGVDLPPALVRENTREARLGVEIRNALAFKLYGSATGAPPTHKLLLRLSSGRSSLIVDPTTQLPSIENYTLNANYSLIDLATDKPVLADATNSRVSYDIPGQFQRFARARAFRDAEDRACQEIAENIQTRLASYFYAAI